MSPLSPTAENRTAVFSRLCGLETEYAIRLASRFAGTPDRPSNYRIYQAIVDLIRQRLPTAEARSFKTGIFTANGGAVWFEKVRQAPDSGLIEGSTPECRGPRQLLAYQRAQDSLLAESTSRLQHLGKLALLKNDRDSRGNLYGAQENYEITIRSPVGLFFWRLGLGLLLPLALPGWMLVIAVSLLYLFVYFPLAGLCYLLLAPFLSAPHRRQVRIGLFGRHLATGDDNGMDLPQWLEPVLLTATFMAVAPLAFGIWLLVRFGLLRSLCRQIVPFMISRSIVAGSGFLDDDGRFQLATKLQGIRTVCGFGEILRDRAIFILGHYVKPLLIEVFHSPRDILSVAGRRQRLQVALGDSNMAEEAEYLRIGTTLLVLDVIDAGQLPPPPRFLRPIRALKAFSADPSLKARAKAAGGRRWSALELQRFYLDACRAFLAKRTDAPEEAHDVVRRWTEVLDALENDPEELVGRIDWVTKRFLMRQAGRDAPHAARKKIDLRYHELSGDGYHAMLARTEFAAKLVDDLEVERAIRTPPPQTPAAARGRLIREFSGGGGTLSVGWSTVILRRGWRDKTVHRLTAEPAAPAQSEQVGVP